MDAKTRYLRLALWAVLVAQLVHLVTALSSGDEENSSEGVIGLPLGALAIVFNIVALRGLSLGRDWASLLGGAVGGGVAFGFILYHAAPWSSWATNPYWGDGSARFVDWVSVVLCVGAGFWALWLAWPRAAAPSGAGVAATTRRR